MEYSPNIYFSRTYMIYTRSEVEPQFQELLEQEISSYDELLCWLSNADDLEAKLSNDFAKRYIAQTVDTSDRDAEKSYNDFLETIYPHWVNYSDKLWRKLIANDFVDQLPSEYQSYLKGVRHGIEVFREENLPLLTQEQALRSQWAKITGACTITYEWKELTMQQAADYLKSSDRTVRKEVFELMEVRRKLDAPALDELLSQLIVLRTTIAHNAWFDTYTNYKYSERFDYSKDHINEFHRSIQQVITPYGQKFFDQRKALLGIDTLQPYDFDAPLFEDVQSELFSSSEEMMEKMKYLLRDMDPDFEGFVQEMQKAGNFDLDSRKSKAPGWYCYPFAQSDHSFIFMNALKDSYGRFTLVHETWHALHHYLTSPLSPDYLRTTPSELAEIASMSMELFTIDDLSRSGLSEGQRKDTLEDKLTKDILFFPRMSKIDLFQQRLYDNPEHTITQRHEHWLELNRDYPYALRTWESVARDEEYKDYFATYRQRQMHIFEVPFYYIDYGIASLASIQLYTQWVSDRKSAITHYKNILSDGYRRSIPEAMKLGDVEFDFSADKLDSLMKILDKKYDQLF